MRGVKRVPGGPSSCRRALEAHEPPEARGPGPRRRATARRHALPTAAWSTRASATCPAHLRAGRLLVVNTSATVPAARRRTAGRRHAGRAAVRHRRAAPARRALVARGAANRPAGRAPLRGGRAGERLELPGDATAELLAPWAGQRAAVARRGCTATTPSSRHGHPVRYGYVPEPWPLDAYQTAFALQPGSAEMPSAGRPFTPELVARLVAGGVRIAPVLLHAGLSSPELGEPPLPERLLVSEHTARLVNAVRGWGGRVVAVGTTVVRALESAAGDDGAVQPVRGFTRPGRHARARAARRGRPADRLARTARHAPRAARGGRRAPPPERAATPRPSARATSGTSSATRTSSCPEGATSRALLSSPCRLVRQHPRPCAPATRPVCWWSFCWRA